ncbi:hypothetical protein OROGR_003415 [Orobanche gracilis]
MRRLKFGVQDESCDCPENGGGGSISNCDFQPGFAIPAAGRSSGQNKEVKRSGLKSLPLDVENPGGDNSRLTESL